jgi:hypothetical protein
VGSPRHGPRLKIYGQRVACAFRETESRQGGIVCSWSRTASRSRSRVRRSRSATHIATARTTRNVQSRVVGSFVSFTRDTSGNLYRSTSEWPWSGARRLFSRFSRTPGCGSANMTTPHWATRTRTRVSKVGCLGHSRMAPGTLGGTDWDYVADGFGAHVDRIERGVGRPLVPREPPAHAGRAGHAALTRTRG